MLRSKKTQRTRRKFAVPFPRVLCSVLFMHDPGWFRWTHCAIGCAWMRLMNRKRKPGSLPGMKGSCRYRGGTRSLLAVPIFVLRASRSPQGQHRVFSR